MDIFSSVLFWVGIVLFFIGFFSFPLYFRRLFDPEASKEYFKTFTILASIAAVFMSVSLYLKKVADLNTILMSLIVFITVLVLSYFIQLFFLNKGAEFAPKYPREEHPFPIDRLKASVKKYFGGKKIE
ncbi:MAG: hypothetical protein JW704_01935 [Anaerolineaceae bacterium]|nr:hypothetical protein [Anaerolineaceae bacterium]MBN2677158.1 hypothetical protein [Anaerolineaceae bacterium]